MFDKFKSTLYEFLSHFAVQKVRYKIEGNCLKCGKCCRYMYSKDTYTEREFKFMQFLYPAYKRFSIVGKDEEGNLIFACRLVDENGLCTVYKKRLRMCKNYPKKFIYHNGKLHEGCGYSVKPEKSFDDYLKK
ncbi:MAG: YkgJ family cysteine cluster protein [Candidatus Gastranaerophilaceae bacterium]